jgi:hypothetical protein
MDPITMMLIGAGVAKAGAGIAEGVGTARAGKKMMLNEREQRELDDLEQRRRAGSSGSRSASGAGSSSGSWPSRRAFNASSRPKGSSRPRLGGCPGV